MLIDMNRFTVNTVFQSKTRLYTNFHAGEHNENFVLSKVKDAIADAMHLLANRLTDDLFVEAVLSGADITPDDDVVLTNEQTYWKVVAGDLTRESANWCLKLFKSPQYYLKSVSGVYTKDGRLCLDMYTDMTLQKNVSKKIFSATTDAADFKSKKTFLYAIFNTITAVKYLFIRLLRRLLSSNPGIGIEGINDVYSVSVAAIDGRMEFERVISNIVEPETIKDIFEMSPDKFF